MNFTQAVESCEMSGLLAQARERAAVLDTVDARRRETLRLVQAMYDFARLAYEAMFGWRPSEDGEDAERADRARSMKAGDLAGQYRAVLAHLAESVCEGSKSKALDIAQKASDWLAAHGLNGIPQFVSESATSVKMLYKSAQVVDADMGRCSVLAAEMRRDARDAARAATKRR